MKLEIYKYNPDVDNSASYVYVNIDYKDKMTVLEAIQFAHEKTPIHFDYSCHGRACGRCSVVYDGTPVLACITPITDGDHTIEPMKGHTVLRDLIIDKSEAHADLSQRYRRTRAVNLTEEQIETIYDTSVAEQISAIEWCTRCMMCTAMCPAYKANPSTYVGPAAMLATAYRYYDPYDEGSRVNEAVQSGLWNCIMCGQCDYVCPQKEIERVSQIWKDLREAATDAGLGNES
ncbi:succinate dehydrogenase and fumarate reductase iron-sulfur protein [Denitrovibrio acetiphilus DSM 12809]|uniref:Fumarate reductase iron-sulfur subunit n=1 Tax=Denitrovibrio acetiphilus (strain DSM 12809 / NBRC 114555 / N2460) TaxID=522772 RepID=D4H666_DENA2|nr:2Fe-2S iron-sulfur cluster-binding protein [Denitrovibrio acetiphilus]ADD67712.1 succinate dehydrogenase and fumarate reductase iron-sulfur protein [Denitrovibrio acetiphilus DSM 12809]